jgi:hypothetical protein
MLYLQYYRKRKEMNDNIKLEVAIEIMASKIAKTSKQGYDINSNEMKLLLEEKEKMYNCDMDTIDKIINVYGKELKECRN